ncbi:hypothetical protein ACA910_021793 [Epithemia clementina (nom. ined.)]
MEVPTEAPAAYPGSCRQDNMTSPHQLRFATWSFTSCGTSTVVQYLLRFLLLALNWCQSQTSGVQLVVQEFMISLLFYASTAVRLFSYTTSTCWKAATTTITTTAKSDKTTEVAAAAVGISFLGKKTNFSFWTTTTTLTTNYLATRRRLRKSPQQLPRSTAASFSNTCCCFVTPPAAAEAATSRRGGDQTILPFGVRSATATTTSTTNMDSSKRGGGGSEDEAVGLFHGRIVAHNFPFCAGGGPMTSMEGMQKHKPTQHAMDPGRIVPGLGPRHYRPNRPLTRRCKEGEIDPAKNDNNNKNNNNGSQNLGEEDTTTRSKATFTTNSMEDKGDHEQPRPADHEVKRENHQEKPMTVLSLYLYNDNLDVASAFQEGDRSAAADPSLGTSTITPAAGAKEESTLLLRLNRQSDETMERTLHRLYLNIIKKMRSPSSSKNSTRPNHQQTKQKKKKNEKPSNPQNEETHDSQPPPQQQQQSKPFSVHKLVFDASRRSSQEDSLVVGEEWDCLHWPSAKVWETASDTPLAIRLDLSTAIRDAREQEKPSNEEEEDDDDEIATAKSLAAWTFLVEANTPFITSVQTFEDFEAPLFVGVPLLVSTTGMYAQSIRVDWYCETVGATATTGRPDHHGQSAGVAAAAAEAAESIPSSWERQDDQSNTPCFIPKPQHVGKRVAVVLTPLPLLYNKNNIEDDKSIISCGSEEAYVFDQPVEPCPKNLLLSLRSPKWTTPSLVTLLQERQRHPHDCLLQQEDHKKTTTTNMPEITNKNPSSFRVVTYNVLADQNAFADRNTNEASQVYASYVDSEILNRKRRLPLILHELLSYQADILCLQEVDWHVFHTLLEPVLRHFSYQGFFSPKQPRQRQQSEQQQPQKTNNKDNNNHPESRTDSIPHTLSTHEGCAMFWSLDRFEPVVDPEQYSFLVRDLLPRPNDDNDGDDHNSYPVSAEWEESTQVVLDLLDKHPSLNDTVSGQLGQVVQIVPLRVKEQRHNRSNNDSPPPQKTLVVSNTHLFFHPLASHVRVIQAFLIARRLSAILQREQREQQQQLAQRRNESQNWSDHTTATVFCGDLNSGLMDAGGLLLLERHVDQNSRKLQWHLNCFKYNKDEEEKESHQEGQDSGSNNNDDNNNAPSYAHDFPELSLPGDTEFPKLTLAMVDTGYPAVTHCIKGFVGTLDHILIDSNQLVALGNAPMPTLAEVQRDTAMPSANLPSDHVSIVVDLAFVADADKIKGPS